MSTRWEIVETDAEQPFHLRLVGGNGETVLVSENYADLRSATHAMHLAMNAAVPDASGDSAR